MIDFLKGVINWLWDKMCKFTFKDWVIVALSVVGLYYAISSYYYEKKSKTPIVIHDNDSLHVYKNKLKEEYAARNVYIQTTKQLKQENSELYNEIKSLKDNPVIVTKTQVVVETDTIYTKSDSIQYVSDSLKTLYWHQNHPEGYYNIAGNTQVYTDFSNFNTKITKMSIPVSMTFDLIEQDKQLKFIGKSDNPYVKITKINGAVVDPSNSKVLKKYFKPKRLSLGVQGGAGIGKDVKFTPYIGIGLNYDLINLW